MPNDDAPPPTLGPARTRTRAKRPAAAKQEIFILIMEGESVRSICAREGMPSKSTVMRWLAADPDFRAGYIASKALYAETLADEIIEISDDATNDWMDRQRDDGTTDRVLDHEHVQRSRLRVDSRKWLAARLSPKRYGDSSMLKIGEVESTPRKELSPTEIAIRLAALAASQNKE